MRLTRRAALRTSAAAPLLFAAGAARAKGDPRAAVNLADLDAVETASRIRNGEISAREAVEAAIERAERINPVINAIVAKGFDGARARVGGAAATGVFAGVPTFQKDLDDQEGLPTGFGSRAFAGNIGRANSAPFFSRLYSLGLVSLGKSSTPEFGLTATTEPLSSGPTRNPWNPDHSVGGSSGGAAALVAAGVTPIAHASDGGGSIRIPASCCGLVGLKVSRGRFPSARDETGVPIRLSVHGAVTRSVRDSAAFYAAMNAPEEGSGLVASPFVAGPSTRRLKIGWFADAPAGTPVEPSIRKATRKAAELCAELGHIVEEIPAPAFGAVGDDFLLYWAGAAAKAVGEWEKAAGRRAGYQEFESLTLGLVRHYETNRASFENAVARLSTFPAHYDAAFGRFDMLLSPVLAAPPPKIGYLSPAHAYDIAIERLLPYAAFTGAANLAGAPAISLPLGRAGDLPVGAHFAARTGEEDALLALAYELEEAAPWAGRKPRVFA